jgi:putative heme-binding domain-containing protein
MEQSPLTMQASALLAALGEGLHRTASSLALVDQSGRLQRFYLAARENAVNEGLALPLRVTSIRLLGVSPYSFADISDWLWLLLGPAEPPAIQSAALAAIGHFNAPEVATGLIERWTRIPAALRAEAVNVLLARTERANALLMALESARIAPSELSSVQIERLRTHRDPAVSRRATQLFGATPFPQPGLVERFLPVLRATGSAPRGHELFVARCAACHRLGGEGQAVGPDLAGAKLEGREKVLRAILKPGPARKPEYATVVVATREGEEFVGVAGDQAGPTVVLRQSGGNSVVLPHDNIDSIHPQRWSFMPEGLEQGFSLQDMADLLEYLMTTPR